MQLSELTFSLASLYVMLSLGLIFAPTSVMAHDNTASGVFSDHATLGHTHPTVTVTAAIRSNTNTAATADPPDAPVHGAYQTEYLNVIFGDDPDTTGDQDNWAEIRLKFTLNTTASTTFTDVVGAITLYDENGVTITTANNVTSIYVEATAADDDHNTGNVLGTSNTFYSDVKLTKGTSVTAKLGYIGFTMSENGFTGTRIIDPKTSQPDTANDKGNLAKSLQTFQVKAAPAPPSTTDVTVRAGEYVVVVPPNHDASALPAGLETHTLAAFPDLNAFFKAGGTIDVVKSGGTKHDVIITEIMVAKDLAKVGQVPGPASAQWIELYNKSGADATVELTFNPGYPAAAAPTGSLDRLSNTVAPGWNFTTEFADALTGSSQKDATANFISLHRKYDAGKRLGDAGVKILAGENSGTWRLSTKGVWDTTDQKFKEEVRSDPPTFLAGRIGTPGAVNHPATFTPAEFKAPAMKVRFNEIANRTGDNEWIELKNVSDAVFNLDGHYISTVTIDDQDNRIRKTIYKFTGKTEVAAGEILLLTADPTGPGNDIAADLTDGVPTPKRYKIVTLGALPNDGEFLLILSTVKDADKVTEKFEKIQDVAGHITNYKTTLQDDNPYTTLWPLSGNVGHISAGNKLAASKVYKRERAIHGYSSNKSDGGEPAFATVGWTGIGYDRNAPNTAENGGTPGYANNSQISADADATDNIIISEIMYSPGKSGKLAQWIELHNMSTTKGVNLNNWDIRIVNHNKDAKDENFAGQETERRIPLTHMEIPPKQTALIVSSAGRNTTNLPNHRLKNLRLTEPMLSDKGFYISLWAKTNETDAAKHQAGDVAGNLIAPASERRTGDQSYTDPVWDLPEGLDENEDRVSITRRIGPKIKSKDGMKQWHWVLTDTNEKTYPSLSRLSSVTFYGHTNDIGSPGQTVGSVLPVSLSKFRPERLKGTGEIVVRWVTESELNNAGFNILRSETRDGEWTRLNEQLIAGQGTTSERTAYEWKDTTAKPNVVYYYQIQDVSLDGDVQTLRQSRLKGNITPAGKLTTTWGELKSQD